MKHYIILMSCFLMIQACTDEREPRWLAPRLALNEATDITRTSARLGAEVNLQGEGQVTECRFTYDTTGSFTPGRLIEADGLSGTVGALADSLQAGTRYYYRVEVSNGYSVEVSETGQFTTQPNTRPSLGNIELINKGPTTAVVRGKLLDNGGETPSAIGFRYRATGETEVHFAAAEVAEDSLFQVRLTRLQLTTTHEVWAYALNPQGESVSDTITFTTDNALFLAEAGTLAASIGEEEKYELTEISVAGEVNGTDIRLLRDMAGMDVEGKETPGKLRTLDLSDASIVSGGQAYYTSSRTREDTISSGMFQGCRALETVRLPRTARVIEKGAFSDCPALLELTLPDDLMAFTPSGGCQALQTYTIAESNEYFTTRDGVLFDKNGEILVSYPAGKTVKTYTVPEGVKEIATSAFASALIDAVQLPESVVELGDYAFQASSVQAVNLPDALQQLPRACFQDCSQLTSIRLGSELWYISAYCFQGCPLTEIRVLATTPPSCGNNAFDDGVFNNASIYVPMGRKKYYRSNEPWNRFPLIQEAD